MAKIKDCVVIDKDFIEDKIRYYKDIIKYNKRQHQEGGVAEIILSHYEELLSNSKPLTPVIQDAWNCNNSTLSDYLNEKEI